MNLENAATPSTQYSASTDPALPDQHTTCLPHTHTPVLVDEVVGALTVDSSSGPLFFVDATAGTGGHTQALLTACPEARVLCLDRDPSAIEACRTRLATFGDRVQFFVGSFGSLPTALESAGFPHRVSGILVDLGVGSHQLDAPERGFSFRRDAPLDMRYSSTGPCASDPASASHILSTWPERRLEELFRVHGEEPSAHVIARAIASWRGEGNRRRKIQSTLELRYVVEDALATAAEWGASGAAVAARTDVSDDEGKDDPPVPAVAKSAGWRPRAGAGGALALSGVRRPTPPGAPAARKTVGYRAVDKLGTWPSAKARETCLTRVAQRRPVYANQLARVFQALRIAVNDEFSHLASLLRTAPTCLAQGGRLVAICFQPREDSAVQAAAAVLCAVCSSRSLEEGGLGSCKCGVGAAFRLVPLPSGARPSLPEIRVNSRARSAHLNVIERCCDAAAAGLESGEGGASWDAALAAAVASALEPVLPPLYVPRHRPSRMIGSSPNVGDADASDNVEPRLFKPSTWVQPHFATARGSSQLSNDASSYAASGTRRSSGSRLPMADRPTTGSRRRSGSSMPPKGDLAHSMPLAAAPRMRPGTSSAGGQAARSTRRRDSAPTPDARSNRRAFKKREAPAASQDSESPRDPPGMSRIFFK